MRTRRRMRLLLPALLAVGILAPSTPASAAASYSQPVWFTWNRATLDVLIVPPGHGQVYNNYGVLGGEGTAELTPYQDSYLEAMEESAADWDQAVAQYGSPTLRGLFFTNVYVVGRDTIPQSALISPEIVITSDETKGPILGVSFSTRPCIISNSKFFITSYTYADMYSISAHEYGHCLGLDHSFGSPDDSVITHDVIYATYNDGIGLRNTHKHCISNLNVLGLERVFGGIWGGPSGGTATISPSSYARISC